MALVDYWKMFKARDGGPWCGLANYEFIVCVGYRLNTKQMFLVKLVEKLWKERCWKIPVCLQRSLYFKCGAADRELKSL